MKNNWTIDFFNDDYKFLLKKSNEELKKIDNIINYFYDLNQCKSLLEQCCGDGSTLNYFKQKYTNIDLKGFDITECYVIECKNKGLNVENANVLKFKEGKYDLIINIGNNFGYFNYENNLKIIKNAAKMSNRFILNVPNIYNVRKNFKENFEFKGIIRTCNLDDYNFMTQKWKYPNGKEYNTEYQYYTYFQLLNMLSLYFKNFIICDENKMEITEQSKEIWIYSFN